MKAIILGGAGFLGSYIYDELKRLKIEPIVFDDLSRGKKENIKDCEKFHQMDLSLMQYNLIKAIEEEKPEYIFHFAAINGTNNFYERPIDVLSINNDITANLFNLLQRCKHRPKIIYASTSEVYNSPVVIPTPEDSKTYVRVDKVRDTYSASKLMGEFYVKHYCEALSLDYLILRIFNVYGKRDVKGI
jgi:nucleoside-diphosphate-sugar epimerase